VHYLLLQKILFSQFPFDVIRLDNAYFAAEPYQPHLCFLRLETESSPVPRFHGSRRAWPCRSFRPRRIRHIIIIAGLFYLNLSRAFNCFFKGKRKAFFIPESALFAGYNL
jgi:hypothetical protein